MLEYRWRQATGDRREAKERVAVLTSLKSVVTVMLNQSFKAEDATLTEAELQTFAKAAYGELLGRTCDDQRKFPHLFETHSLFNRSCADYYQRLCENGGYTPLLEGEEQALRMRGWDHDRIQRLVDLIKHVEAGHPPIKDHFINHHLETFGYETGEFRRKIVRRALYPAYRDACLQAEEVLQASILPPSPAALPLAPPVAAVVVVDNEPPAETLARPRMSELMQQAVNGLVADEAWGAKSGRQLFSTVIVSRVVV